MFKLDNAFLEELGLGTLPPVEKNKMLAHVYETLEMRVGVKLAEQMSNEQLDEFESYINSKDEAGALKWLETNFPNYKQVVAQELDKLKGEIKAVAPQIVAQAEQVTNSSQQQPAPQQSIPQQPQQQAPPQQTYSAQQQTPQPSQQPLQQPQPQPINPAQVNSQTPQSSPVQPQQQSPHYQPQPTQAPVNNPYLSPDPQHSQQQPQSNNNITQNQPQQPYNPPQS